MARGVQVTVASTATKVAEFLTATSQDPISVIITNRGTASVFLGGSDVTTGTGYEVGTGETVPLDMSGDTVWGIAAANQRVDVLVVGE